MQKQIIVCLAFCLFAALPGCKSVVSDHLIGEPLSDEEAVSYEGIWHVGDGVLHIKHIGAGTLVVAGLDWKEEGFKLDTHTVVITVHGEARFAQLLAEEEEDGDESEPAENIDAVEEVGVQTKTWGLLGMLVLSEDHALVLYPPNFDRFKQALDDSQLVGELKDDDRTLHIHGDKAALDGFIQSGILHELFNFQEPGVLERIDR